MRAPEFAFRGREFKIDLTVQAYGLKGKSVPLYFNRGKNLIYIPIAKAMDEVVSQAAAAPQP